MTFCFGFLFGFGFGLLCSCHIRVGHSRRAKTWDEIKANYAWIRHDIVKLFVATCRECSTRVPLKKPAAGKPLKTPAAGKPLKKPAAGKPLKKPAAGKPLKKPAAGKPLKTPAAGKPLKKPAAGKPTISLGFLTSLQIDLIDMRSRPDGDKWILHIRDHFSKFSWTHPLTSKRSSEVAENRSQGLLHATYAINISTSSTTGKPPYEVVFGQPPRTTQQPGNHRMKWSSVSLPELLNNRETTV